MTDRVLIVHPDRIEEVVEELKRRGFTPNELPSSPDRFLAQLPKLVNGRWKATGWLFVPPDSVVAALYESTLISYVTGNNIAAVLGGVAVAEGLLRSSVYELFRDRRLRIEQVDVALDDKLQKLTLHSLCEKAKKHGLITSERESFIKDVMVGLRNSVQHGNPRQIVRAWVGDETLVDGVEVDLQDWSEKQESKALRDFSPLAAVVFREMCKKVAVEVLAFCCEFSVELDATIATHGKDDLPLEW